MGMGARAKRVERMRRVFPDLDRLRGLEGELNGSWLTLHASQEAWFEVPLPVSYCKAGMSDEVLAASNYEVARARLEAAALFDDGVSYRWDHWVGPPIETLVIRADDAGAVAEAMNIIAWLEDYPILSEEDYCERERAAEWEAWENCFRSDVESIMIGQWDIPEDLFWPQGWGEQGVTVDLDELVTGCPTWQNWSLHESIDLDELAGELAGAIRRKLAGPDADKRWARDCWCCGAPVIGPVWSLCDGCEGHEQSGEHCDSEDSWHCNGADGHECDGTVCEESAADARYEASLPEIYGGMHPDRMTPLW